MDKRLSMSVVQEETEPDAHVYSVRFKRKMNRLFREQFGYKTSIPHPEVDNLFERLRSLAVISREQCMEKIKRNDP